MYEYWLTFHYLRSLSNQCILGQCCYHHAQCHGGGGPIHVKDTLAVVVALEDWDISLKPL